LLGGCSRAIVRSAYSCVPRAWFSSAVCGVGQPASHTTRPSRPLFGTVPSLDPSLWSRVVGVGQPAIVTTWPKLTATFRPSGVLPVALRPSKLCEPIALPTVGVGQPAYCTANDKCVTAVAPIWMPRSTHARLRARCCSGVPPGSCAAGVGHPIQPVSDVRSTDARRRKRDRPDGVIQGFQVSLYKVEPRICVLARNLLSKDDCRAALRDEMTSG